MRNFGNTRCNKLALAVTMGVLLLVGMSASAWALPLVDENFSYAVGSALVGQGGWAQTGTTATNPILVTSPTLSYPGYPGSGIGNAIGLVTSGQDVNKPFTGITAGNAYAAALVNVTSSQTVGDYFFHFVDGPITGNIFRGRVFVKKDPASTNYAFGVQSSSANTSLVYTGFNYVPGTTYLIVLKYSFVASTNNDTVSLFVDPAISMTEPAALLTTVDAAAADATNLDLIGVRQGGASNSAVLQLDGIRVGSDWGDVVVGTAVDPTGACCNTATGACTITTQAACGFTWLGQDVACTVITCPNPDPIGACCNSLTAACTLTTASNCVAPNVWNGAVTSCTPNPCPALEKTLCDVAADDPVTMRPVLEGALVHVTGLALVNDHQWQTTNDDFEITDGQCCVSIFGGGIAWPTVLAGDMIDVVATVGFYNGKTELTTPGLTMTVLSSGNPLPSPAEITTFQLASQGETYDDCFIKIRCVQIVGGDPWPIAGSNANIQIDDGSGVTVLRIDKETDIDGTPAPVGKFTVIGLGTQFDSTSPFSDSYQILPRSLADLVFDCTAACCDPAGICTVALQSECLAPSVWHGEWAGCVPNNCPIPTGACCDAAGLCTVTIPADCVAPSVWHGEWSTCDLAACPMPVGACCFLDGHCEILTEAECTVAPDHVQWVPGATCGPEAQNPCAQPGACCDLSTGTCTFVLEALCVAPLVFHADLTCVPTNPCPQPGACCDPNTGNCTFVLPENCPQGWMWLVGVVCVPSNPCPPPVPTGACCDPQGLCTITTQVACVAPSMWHPEWTSCVPNFCPPPVPTEQTTWGKIKANYR
jgi:hypothetical protein